jgi:RNAse (barnase) inhibitor barstar
MNHWLRSPDRAGVYHLTGDARELAQAAESAGLAVYRIDIGHAHDKKDFLAHLSRAMGFPASFGGNWDALADSLKDLSWTDPHAAGWVVVLEKSKHFCAGHRHEFEEAMDIMAEAAEFWRAEARPLWTLIGGPEGWSSGWPPMPAD